MNADVGRVHRAKAGLVVVDIQERLLPAIFEKERVLQNSVRLIKAAQILKVPVLATEQYRKGLGVTVSEVAQAIEAFSPLQKITFSACGAERWSAIMEARGLSQFILCGVEAHVCVTQTCLDLLEAGYRVFVVADAISSRTPENHRLGVERMRHAGAVIVSTEMTIFELLQKAGTEEFKRVLELVK